MDYKKYLKIALDMGAEHAVFFQIKDIEFDSRTILKCMFGCADWGKGNTCPSRPASLRPWEYQKILENYTWGIIVHATNKYLSQKISYSIERQAFLDGYYFSFSMSDCALCKECNGFKGKECANPKLARPAFHSVGIDVYKTVRKFGLPIETLKNEDDPQNWYSAIFIE